MEYLSRPEQEEPEYGQVFNLDAMSIEQIQRLNQGLWAGYDKAMSASQDIDNTRIEDSLLDRLGESIQALASRDIVRGREVLTALAASEEPHDREMAAECAPDFANYDAQFASDVVVQLQGDSDIGDASNVCLWKLKERLTPEQAADLVRRAEQQREWRWTLEQGRYGAPPAPTA